MFILKPVLVNCCKWKWKFYFLSGCYWLLSVWFSLWLIQNLYQLPVTHCNCKWQHINCAKLNISFRLILWASQILFLLWNWVETWNYGLTWTLLWNNVGMNKFQIKNWWKLLLAVSLLLAKVYIWKIRYP